MAHELLDLVGGGGLTGQRGHEQPVAHQSHEPRTYRFTQLGDQHLLPAWFGVADLARQVQVPLAVSRMLVWVARRGIDGCT